LNCPGYILLLFLFAQVKYSHVVFCAVESTFEVLALSLRPISSKVLVLEAKVPVLVLDSQVLVLVLGLDNTFLKVLVLVLVFNT